MNLDKIQSILACEIECGIFETHVLPALNVVRSAAPSVEQDERRAFRDTLRAALKSYRRANPSRYLNDDQVDASDSEFVSDLMTYVPVGERARAASTSANVAQCDHKYIYGQCKKCGCISAGE